MAVCICSGVDIIEVLSFPPISTKHRGSLCLSEMPGLNFRKKEQLKISSGLVGVFDYKISCLKYQTEDLR